MVFSELHGPVKDVFKISGFGSIFTIYDTEEDALKVLREVKLKSHDLKRVISESEFRDIVERVKAAN